MRILSSLPITNGTRSYELASGRPLGSSSSTPSTPSPSMTQLGSNLSILSPAHFAWEASEGRWKPYPHLMLLNRFLIKVALGEITRLMVFAPPRHGKSELLSRYFPAWFLGINPNLRVILTSYEATFAESWGRKARNLLENHGEKLFNCKVDPRSSAGHAWNIKDHDGGMITAGARGPITGHGGDLILIDDPIKNDQEAFSETVRDGLWSWYLSTLSTRLQPGGRGRICLTMARWHPDDLAGRLVTEMHSGSDQWTILNLPAIAELDDPLGRREGEPLCPQMYTLEQLEKIRRRSGPLFWDALYQGHPSNPEGNIFKKWWWRFFDNPPQHFDHIIESWDMSFKDLTTSSYVVGQVWGKLGVDYYLLDQLRDRLDFPSTVRAVKALSQKHPGVQEVLIEDAANGPAVISTLGKEIPGIIPVTAKGSKEARAAAKSYLVEAGNVYLPAIELHPWVEIFIQECTTFPRSVDKDQVDAMSQALNRLDDGDICYVY